MTAESQPLPAGGHAQPETITLKSLLIVLCSTVATASYAFTWNAVSVALPHMQGAFSATIDQIAWVMIAFVIGSAIATASIGWFSLRFGRRQVFLIAVTGYAISLVGCGFSETLEQQVLWRLFQGLSGAALLPLSQAIAVNAFPADRHGAATSLWALGFVATNVFAPTLSGILIEHFGWPWIYFATLPIALTVLVLSLVLVPRTPRHEEPLDWLGFGSLILGVGVLQLMLARGERLDWFESTEILVESVIGGLALYIFVAHSLTAKRPFINPAIFRNRNFCMGQVFVFIVGGVIFLPLVLLPLMLKQIGDYSAIETGYLLFPRGIGSVLGLILMARLRDRVDPRPILFCGLALLAAATWIASTWTVEIDPSAVRLVNFIQGCATGAIWAPLNTLTLAKLDKRYQDQGFALFYLNYEVGNAIGTAVVIGVHQRHSQINSAIIGERVTPFSDWSGSFLVDYWSIENLAGIAALSEEVYRQAAMIAYNNSYVAITAIIVLLFPFILLFRHRWPKVDLNAAAAESP